MEVLSEQDKKYIEAIDLFSEISSEDFSSLYNSIIVRTAQPGSMLISQGESGDSLFVLLQGELEIFLNRPTSERFVLTTLKPGNIVGEDVFSSNSTGYRTASVIAITDVRIAEIKKSLLMPLINQYPSIAEKFLRRESLHAYDRMLRLTVNLREIHVTLDEIQYIHTQSYQTGEVIFSENDAADAIYFVLEGGVDVIKIKEGKKQVIAQLQQGQCLGELSLLEHKLRFATAIANNTTRLLKIDQTLFYKWHTTHPVFRDMLQTLQNVYHLRDNSLIGIYRGTFEGKECFSTIRTLTNGAKFISSKIIDEDTIVFYKLNDNTTQQVEHLSYQLPDGTSKRELHLLDNKLIGVVSTGPWVELNKIIGMVMQGEVIPEWRRILFQQRGEINLEYTSQLIEDNSLICMCMRVTYKDICRALSQYGDKINAIISVTGATLICGNCKITIEELVGQAEYITLKIDQIKCIASNIWSIHLQSVQGDLPKWKPGQYITLRAKLSSGWVQRSYTLSNTIDNKTWEIIVLRQALGVMSNWLTGEHHENVILQATTPRGFFTLKPHFPPVIFFAAGIGITPALAMLRAKIPQFFLHYSVTHEKDFICLEELTKNPNIILHSTAKQGYVSKEIVEALIAQHPNAEIMICGPDNYRELLFRILKELAIPQEKIRFESFMPGDSQSVKTAKIQGEKLLFPVFSNDQASDVELFLNEVYSNYNLWDVFKDRVIKTKDEIKKNKCFIPTIDEIQFGIRKILTQFSLDTESLYIIDRRVIDSGTELSSVLHEHQYLAESSQMNIVITLIDTKFSLPNSLKTVAIELTSFCHLQAIITTGQNVTIPDSLHYHFDTSPRQSLPSVLTEGLPWYNPKTIYLFIKNLTAITTRPIETFSALHKKYHNNFSVQTPLGPVENVSYINLAAYNDLLEMPEEISRIGPLLKLVPAIGYWFRRSRKDDEWLQALAVTGRGFIRDHLVNADQLAIMPPIIKRIVTEHAGRWENKIDLCTSLIPAIYDASATCLIGEKTWAAIKDEAIPLFRIIANGVDISRISRAHAPFSRFMPEYKASRKAEKLLLKTLNNVTLKDNNPFLAKLAMLEVDGKPILADDMVWEFMYVLWNAFTYMGSYGTWCLVHILNDKTIYQMLQEKNLEDKRLFLSDCLTETIRLNPVASTVRSMGCPMDFKQPDVTYRIPKDTFLSVFPYQTCHSEKLYTNSNSFNPLRYSAGEKIPEMFARGPFGCVAVQYTYLFVTTFLSELLHHYKLELLQTPPLGINRVHLIYPKDPIWVGVVEVD